MGCRDALTSADGSQSTARWTCDEKTHGISDTTLSIQERQRWARVCDRGTTLTSPVLASTLLIEGRAGRVGCAGKVRQEYGGRGTENEAIHRSTMIDGATEGECGSGMRVVSKSVRKVGD